MENEYERQRQENILKNKQLLAELQINATALAIKSDNIKREARPAPSSHKRKRTVLAFKKEPEEYTPRRTSSRLRGIVADSEIARQEAENVEVALKIAENTKRQRVAGDMELADIVVNGRTWDKSTNFFKDVKGEKYVRDFTDDDVEKTTDKDLKEMRQKMSGLQLHERFEPNEIKITPERIYSLGFHPTESKQLVFAGDKLGTLGIFDATNPVDNPDYDATEEDSDPSDSNLPNLTAFKLHSRTISTFFFEPTSAESLYTASYDGSIRQLDLNAQKSVEVYAGADDPIFDGEEALMSGVERMDAHTLYFSTLKGVLGRKDTREPSSSATIFHLTDKKIGGFTLNPRAPHLAATASLDRTVKIWDLRKITGKGDNKTPHCVAEHTSKLSVSAAIWNTTGSVVTTSYDDTIKVYKMPDSRSWKEGYTVDEFAPDVLIPHNNQTGRWVTILRAQWQLYPQNNSMQKFVIGNMKRFVDVYSESGEQLAQLGGEQITAVPAVAQFHQTQDWIAAGTASGKICLWA